MSARRLLTLAALLAAACMLVLWAGGVPLGVPGEWTWLRIRYGGEGRAAELVSGIAAAALSLALYVGFCWLGARRMSDQHSRAETAGWVLALTAAGFAVVSSVRQAAPASYGWDAAPIILYSRGASGYFAIAREDVPDVATLLRGYEARMREGDLLHVGTHPPGLIVLHRLLLNDTSASRLLTRLVRGVTPPPVDDGFDAVDVYLTPRVPLSEADRAALWLAILLTGFAGAATVGPLFLLVRRSFSRATAWRAACLWPLVPALSIFLPKSDALYPFVGLAFLWLWLEACGRRSIVRGVAAGVVLWLGMFFSLALLPVALAGVLAAVFEGRSRGSQTEGWGCTLRAMLRPAAGAAAGFVTPVLGLWLVYGLNLPLVWWLNLENHAAFYEQPQYARTYWKWLLVNPVELTFAVGAPLAVAAAVGLWRSLRNPDARLRALRPAALACAIVLGILWLSGKNMGEAARLWLVIQPWSAWLAAAAVLVPASTPGSAPGLSRRGWIWLLTLQAVVCLTTVQRVTGFHF
ncbi:MAG: glycosyltransferase family 39 protein [Planctomycetes bacterium]|nr:glycosyltransferase family 39 protein [Planctomycetota bacterium]